ncbi:MAG: ribokinase [Oscillospiraceae bacterium]|nr:ribokinase [Oscillospiraceae bacterium]
MPNILIIGSLNMDMVTVTDTLPRPGETCIGSAFRTIPGGKGANQAAAAARLGGSAAMLGCVGADVFGAALLTNLERFGVDVSAVRKHADAATGVAAITVSGGDNSIIVVPGANSALSPRDMEAAQALFAWADTIVLQLEIPMDTVRSAVRLGKKHKKTVILNPAPAAALNADVLSHVDILTPNESEAECLTGLPVTSVKQAITAALHLAAVVPEVVITLGANGAVWAHGASAAHFPAYKVAAVDSTAAGDTFTGALAVRLAMGDPMPEAISYAQGASALAVQRLGAQDSIPTAAEAEQFLQKTP